MTAEIFGPAHDGKRSAGATVRVLPTSCFGVGHGTVASTRSSPSGDGAEFADATTIFGSASNEILKSRNFAAREQMLTTGCKPVEAPKGAPPPRPLNYVVPKDQPWPPMDKCKELDLVGLCEVVKQVGAISIKSP